MTVEELLELKRKADAIAEIEKTVAKETNRYDLLIDNLRQIVKFIKDTLVDTGIGYAQFKTEEDDRIYTFVGFHKDGEFYIKFPGSSDYEINEESFIEDVTYKRGTVRGLYSDFIHLADKWVRIKEEFLLYIKKEYLSKIKCSHDNIAAMTEDYITAKEFQL